MKVPTYRSQTQRSNISGAEQLQVRAAPGQFAQTAQASFDFATTAQRASLNALDNAQKEQLLAFEQQQEKDLLEFEIDKKTTFEQEKNQNMLSFKKQLSEASIKAKFMDPAKAVDFFDNEKKTIAKNLSKNFTSQNALREFQLDSESDYIHRRISVKSDAMNRKINSQAATYLDSINTYKADYIYGNAAEKKKAEEKIFGKGGFFDKMVELGYYNEAEATTKKQALQRDLLEESTIKSFNDLNTMEEKQNFINLLKKNPLKPLGPGKNRSLVAKLESDLGDMKKINVAEIKEVNASLKEMNKILMNSGTVKIEDIEVLEGKARSLNSQENVALANKLKIKQEIFSRMRKKSPTEVTQIIRTLRTEGLANYGAEGIDTVLETELLKEAESFSNKMRTELSRDPLNFAGGAGLIKFKELDLMSPNFEVDISKRIQHAQAVNTVYGTPLTFLSESEQQIFSSFFNNKNNSKADRLSFLARLNQGFGKHTGSVLKELSQKGSPDLAHIGGLFLQGNVPAATKALDGLDLKNSGIVQEATAQDYNDVFRRNLGDALRFLPTEVQGATRNVAVLIYNAIQAEQGETQFRPKNMEKALKLALGGRMSGGDAIGGIEDVNGEPTLIPKELSAKQLEDMLKTITPDKISSMTGLNLNREIVDDINDGDYDLFAKGDGTYYLARGKGDEIRILADSSGNRIVIDALSFYNLRDAGDID